MHGPFFELTAWLYYLCFLLLAALLLLIAVRSRSRSRRRFRPHPTRQYTTHLHNRQLRRAFFLLALALLLWQLTLFSETRTTHPAAWLWLGRLNFTAMVLAPYFALRFVQAVAHSGTLNMANRWLIWCRAETVLLAALTLLTPLIDAAERVENGQALSTYGPLFPLYIVHVALYWLTALIVAIRERRRAEHRRERDQLTLIGGGMLTTGAIALIANVLLPYGFGNFRWCDMGALSTFLFLLAIAYATLRRRLFDLRVFVRETLVYGLLLAFVLGGYSSAVFVVSQYLTEGAGKGMQFAVLLIAFSFDPLRRFLEEKTDRFLFGSRKAAGQQRSRRRGNQTSTRLALLFPWRHP